MEDGMVMESGDTLPMTACMTLIVHLDRAESLMLRSAL